MGPPSKGSLMPESKIEINREKINIYLKKCIILYQLYATEIHYKFIIILTDAKKTKTSNLIKDKLIFY